MNEYWKTAGRNPYWNQQPIRSTPAPKQAPPNKDAAARAMLAALNGLLNAGSYNNEGEWTLPSSQWDGQGDPPHTSDHPAMAAAEAAIAQAEAAGITAEE